MEEGRQRLMPTVDCVLAADERQPSPRDEPGVAVNTASLCSVAKASCRGFDKRRAVSKRQAYRWCH